MNSDIDVIADNKAERKILLGECKWRNEPVDASDVQKLLSKERLIPGYDEYRYMFFSKSPYTEAARRLATKRKDVELVTLDMLY
jgi:HJR/Mrr/RecB family endonuclease